MNRMFVKSKRVFNRIGAALTALFLSGAVELSTYASGGPLGDTQLVKGSLKLISDLTTILLIAAPLVGIACIIYFQIRKSAADEQDQKRWQDRTMVAAVCIIIAVCASSLVKVIVNSYMGGNI